MLAGSESRPDDGGEPSNSSCRQFGEEEEVSSVLHHLQVKARKPACAACGGWHPGPSLDRALRKLGAITVRAYAGTAQYVNISAILQSAGPNPLQVMRITGVVRNPG